MLWRRPKPREPASVRFAQYSLRMQSMRLWQLASAAFFLYVAAVSLWQGLSRRAARQALAGAAVGLAVLALSRVVENRTLSLWIWPPALLLIGYWSSGRLFIAPSCVSRGGAGVARCARLYQHGRSPRAESDRRDPRGGVCGCLPPHSDRAGHPDLGPSRRRRRIRSGPSCS